MMIGDLLMNGFQETIFTLGVGFTVIYWRGSSTHIHRHQLDCGLKQGEEVMKKNIHWIGIPGGMRRCMLIYIIKQILFLKLISIMRLVYSGWSSQFDNNHDLGFGRPARYGGRDRDDYAYEHYDYRHRVSHQSREDSRERDYDYGRHSYDSDYDRGSRRDSNWRRRDSRDREHDRRASSRERDHSPYTRHERSRSRSRDRDDRLRSRSPRSRSHSRSHREDSYDDIRYDRSERRRDHDDRRHHDSYSVVCFIIYFFFVDIIC